MHDDGASVAEGVAHAFEPSGNDIGLSPSDGHIGPPHASIAVADGSLLDEQGVAIGKAIVGAYLQGALREGRAVWRIAVALTVEIRAKEHVAACANGLRAHLDGNLTCGLLDLRGVLGEVVAGLDGHAVKRCLQVCHILVGLRLLVGELGVLAAQLLVVGIDRARELRYVDEERHLLHISLAVVGELHGDISARHAHTAIILDVAAFKRHLETVGKLRHPCARASMLVNDACDGLGADVRATTVDVDLCCLARVGGHNAICGRVEHHRSVLDDKLHGIFAVGAWIAILPILALMRNRIAYYWVLS